MTKRAKTGGTRGSNQYGPRGVSKQDLEAGARAGEHASKASRGASAGVVGLGQQMTFDFPPRTSNLRGEDILQSPDLIKTERGFAERVDALKKVEEAVRENPTAERWVSAMEAVCRFSDSMVEDSAYSRDPETSLKNKFNESWESMKSIFQIGSEHIETRRENMGSWAKHLMPMLSDVGAVRKPPPEEYTSGVS